MHGRPKRECLSPSCPDFQLPKASDKIQMLDWIVPWSTPIGLPQKGSSFTLMQQPYLTTNIPLQMNWTHLLYLQINLLHISLPHQKNSFCSRFILSRIHSSWLISPFQKDLHGNFLSASLPKGVSQNPCFDSPKGKNYLYLSSLSQRSKIAFSLSLTAP